MISLSSLYCGNAETSDALRYGKAGERSAGRRLRSPSDRKPVVVWNCTRACNLRCVHCYAQSTGRADADELTTAQGLALLEDLAAFGVPVVLFSGGEPLLRPDLFELVARAAELRMRAAISTNGTRIDAEAAERLRDAGASYVGVSLDGMRGTNDRFRGVAGAFDQALAGIRHCREAGLKVGLRFTITRRNVGEVDAIFSLARDENIPRVCFYHLVYAGRGSALMADDLDHEATRRTVDLIIDGTARLRAEGHPREVLTVDNHTDGPYLYLRMVRENHPGAERALRLLRAGGGNSSGIGIGCVGWDGAVRADQFWQHTSFGKVSERPFSEIWTDTSHPLLAKLRRRRPHLKGRCAQCRFLSACNGNCRVRAEAATGDLWAPDPACYLTDKEIALEADRPTAKASLKKGTGTLSPPKDLRSPFASRRPDLRPPRIVAWEVTRSCPLACKHCRAAASAAAYSDELSTEECFRLLSGLASFARPMIILTGGEPLLRADIFEIAHRARRLGLDVVLATCGTMLNDATAARIAESGIRSVSVSLDGASAESHDAFRGTGGAFAAALQGIEAARRIGLPFQVNTTVTRHNRAELPAILDLAVSLGALCFNPFLLVPTGRGRALAAEELSAPEYEETLRWLAGQHDRTDIRIRVTCAPHYQRILRQRPFQGETDLPGGGGCLGGKSFAFISHRGKVQICGFLDVECGDLREEGFDFQKIWATSDVLRQVRDLDSYRGRCGYCEFRQACGGCRARAYAMTGDYLAEEPFCVHQPRRPPQSRTEKAEPDELDRKILAAIQDGLPAVGRPFAALARRLRTDSDELLSRVRRMVDEGVIRRLGPIFDSRRLGYDSTLVAAKVPADRLEEVAARVGALPGVTHNYERRHTYNLWFTLTARSAEEIERRLETLRRETGISDFHSLPALAAYKIRVRFPLGDEGWEEGPAAPVPPAQAADLEEDQKKLVRALQDDFPLAQEPFARVAARAGWSTERVIDQIREWLESGVIRRFGAVLAHRRLGFTANGMAVFRAEPDRIDAMGRRLAECPQVTHCYRRPPLPDFPYSLYAMFHGRTENEVRTLVSRIAEEMNLSDYGVLFSVTEFKRSAVRYFSDASAS